MHDPCDVSGSANAVLVNGPIAFHIFQAQYFDDLLCEFASRDKFFKVSDWINKRPADSRINGPCRVQYSEGKSPCQILVFRVIRM